MALNSDIKQLLLAYAQRLLTLATQASALTFELPSEESARLRQALTHHAELWRLLLFIHDSSVCVLSAHLRRFLSPAALIILCLQASSVATPGSKLAGLVHTLRGHRGQNPEACQSWSVERLHVCARQPINLCAPGHPGRAFHVLQADAQKWRSGAEGKSSCLGPWEEGG